MNTETLPIKSLCKIEKNPEKWLRCKICGNVLSEHEKAYTECGQCKVLYDHNNQVGLTFEQFKYFIDQMKELKCIEQKITDSIGLLYEENQLIMSKPFIIIQDCIVASMNVNFDGGHNVIYELYYKNYEFPLHGWDSENNEVSIDSLRELYEVLTGVVQKEINFAKTLIID